MTARFIRQRSLHDRLYVPLEATTMPWSWLEIAKGVAAGVLMLVFFGALIFV